MRSVLLAVVMLATAGACRAADPAKATGTLEGHKVTFPEKGVADGVKATIGLLESCIDESLYDADELKKAQEENHIRLVFARPMTVRVMRGEVEFSELVFRLPLNTGVFWLRSGDKVRRYSKYRHEKVKPFEDWLREAQPSH